MHAPPAPGYTGGTIQRVDVSTGNVELLYADYEGRTFGGPNDIIFAADGSFWFTDYGKWTPDGTRHGGLYHAGTDGRTLRQVAFGTCLNGVGLSPDGKRAYAAATAERWILGFDTDPAAGRQQGEVLANFPGRQHLNSMAMEASGTIAVGCLIEHPGIGRVDPASGAVALVPTPDTLPTNICFGGADMRDAYITFTGRGALAKCRWPVRGCGCRSIYRGRGFSPRHSRAGGNPADCRHAGRVHPDGLHPRIAAEWHTVCRRDLEPGLAHARASRRRATWFHQRPWRQAARSGSSSTRRWKRQLAREADQKVGSRRGSWS